jgi:Flp pilus assembly pilin Flp
VVRVFGLVRRFWSDQSAATAIEYALVCGIIAVAVVSIAATGGALDTMYNDKVARLIGALVGGGDGDEEDGGG